MTHNNIRINRFLNAFAGFKIKPIQVSTNLSQFRILELQKDFRHIESAMKKIYAKLQARNDRQGLLDIFGVDRQLLPYISDFDFPEFLPMLRIDAIPTQDGALQICELNVDSSLGGLDNFQLHRLSRFQIETPEVQDPHFHVANLIEKVLNRSNFNKIVILDWSRWQDAGHYSLNWFKISLEYRIPGVEVRILNEKNVFEFVDKQTLVFRYFTSEDMLSNIDFYCRLQNSVGQILFDFSSEIFSSKNWFSLFWEQSNSALLNENEKNAIKKWIPETIKMNADNIDYFLQNKNKYFFKAISGFGGSGVFPGCEFEEKVLYEKIMVQNTGSVIAQRIVPVEKIQIKTTLGSKPQECKSVIGIYRIDGSWCGYFVRASRDSSVINVATGAMAGWGYLTYE